MTDSLTTSRASRNRRLIAATVWGALVLAAAILWNGRQLDHIRSVSAEPVAFLLSAFAAFVSVFAWMLFNPNRRAANESPTLFLAGAVTLLPPCIIGFCLMPADSPLRGWLAFGLLAIVVIAVLSPVPEEFFAIPRLRSTYLQPTPEMEIPDSWISVTETNWLKDPAVAKAVAAIPRPSLAPSAYRGRAADELDGSRPSRAERLAEQRRQKAEQQKTEQQRTERRRVAADRPVESQPSRSARRDSEPVEVPARSRRPPVPAVDVRPTDLPPRDLDVFEDAKPLDFVPPQHVEKPVPPVPPVRPPVPPVRPPVPPVRPDERSEIPLAATARAAALPLILLDDFEDNPEPPVARQAIGFRSEPLPTTSRVEHEAHDALAAPQFERYKDESGSELVEGTMTVRFERGQKRANLHIPFSPPLAGAPEVECEAVGDLPVRLKVPVRQSYGLRIEARRSNADEAAETEIGFAAIYSPSHQAG